MRGKKAKRPLTEIMDGVACTEYEQIAPNTVRYVRADGTEVIRLHLTDIIEFRIDGSIMLTTGGWKTPLTKLRMNRFVPDIHIYQSYYNWYLFRSRYRVYGAVPFKDGVVLHLDGLQPSYTERGSYPWVENYATYEDRRLNDQLHYRLNSYGIPFSRCIKGLASAVIIDDTKGQTQLFSDHTPQQAIMDDVMQGIFRKSYIVDAFNTFYPYFINTNDTYELSHWDLAQLITRYLSYRLSLVPPY